jgi:hypothetical protein
MKIFSYEFTFNNKYMKIFSYEFCKKKEHQNLKDFDNDALFLSILFKGYFG